MRILFAIILLFNSFISNSQLFGVYKPPNAPESCGSPTVRGEFIRDNFTGSSLSANWTVLNPGSQTITVSGGKIRFQGSAGTTKNVSQMLKYTGYATTGFSTLRNYTVRLDSIQFNSLTSTDKGPFVGVEPRANDNNLAASWANVDPSNTDSVEILQTNQFQNVGNTARTSTGLPAINTSDYYRLELTEYEDTITCTFTNLSASTSVSVKYGWNTITASPRRPPIFTYSWGGCGSTDFTAESFSVSTTEMVNAKYIFAGNSITTGYSAGSFLYCYPYQLRNNTSCRIQVMAGPGNGAADLYANRFEIIAMNPTYLFCMIGTNDGAHGGGQTTFRLAVDAFEAAGITVFVLPIPNGQDIDTPGTFNNSLATYFPLPGQVLRSVWTQAWAVMLGNPTYMFDSLHPVLAGEIVLAAAVKTDKGTLFPN